jgi:hypothetical protein
MLILFRTFVELSEVLFLCQNLTMEDILHVILNPYVSVSEKDILWEIMKLEEENELSTNAELRTISTNATALCG